MAVHWREFLESEVVRFVDLKRDYVVQIKEVKKGKVVGAGGKSSGKAMIYFVGWPKPVAAGTALLSLIAGMYGNDTTKWQNEWITLYGDPTIKFGGAVVGGVRCRPTPPAEKDRVHPKIGDANKGAA